MPDSIVSIRDLSVEFRADKTYNRVTHGVSFEVPAGKTLALVGESGSGKSVTAMSIMNLLPANARRTGVIEMDGENLIGASPARMRQLRGTAVAMVFQEPMTALNPVHTIGALLQQAIRAHDKKSTGPQVAARALELLRLVEMPDPEQRLQRYPHQLSGGQRQRAMIAMAVAHNPRLLIADEPTTALDVTAQAVILDLMIDLRDRLGMSLLMITHDMGVVADIADQVVVMKDGSVVETAPVDDLFHDPQETYTKRLLAAVPHLGRSPIVESIPKSSSRGLLDIEALNVTYPARFGHKAFTAVDGVSLQIGRGEIVGLVGESGSGKSTIGRAIVGLSKATSGTVSVDGIDVSKASKTERRELRKSAAIIFQDPASSLNPRATIGESITAPLRWNKIERNRRVLDAKVDQLLDNVHLPRSFAGRYPHELSGGQRQRIGIARAMAMEPDLLIADEPTSALDVSVQEAVLKLLSELQEQREFSCLFISHDLSVVEQLAHRIIVLKSGQIVEQGDTRQILHHPLEAYTQQLVGAIPVPDPTEQRARRQERQQAVTPFRKRRAS